MDTSVIVLIVSRLSTDILYLEFIDVKPMPNPKPKITEAFLAQQKPKYGDKPLGATMGIRFPEDIDQVLRQMSDRQDYIRQAVEDRLRADGLIPSP